MVLDVVARCQFSSVWLFLFIVLILIIQAWTPKSESVISRKQVLVSSLVCRLWVELQDNQFWEAQPAYYANATDSSGLSKCPEGFARGGLRCSCCQMFSSKLSLWARCVHRVRPWPYFIEFLVGEDVSTSASSSIGAISSYSWSYLNKIDAIFPFPTGSEEVFQFCGGFCWGHSHDIDVVSRWSTCRTCSFRKWIQSLKRCLPEMGTPPATSILLFVDAAPPILREGPRSAPCKIETWWVWDLYKEA